MRWIFFVFSSLTLSGCETIPQQHEREQRQARAGLEAALDSATAKCRSDWETDARLAPIRDKIPLVISTASFVQLNDIGKPNEVEKNAIVALDEVKQACNQSIYALRARIWPPERSALMQQYLSDARSILGTLWNGSMTYGQYITESNKQLNAYIYSDEKLARGLLDEYKRAEAQEQQARAARMQAWSQYIEATKAQPMQIQTPQPKQTYQTSCNSWTPGQVDCTTR